jgi:hypothetical protein
MPCVVCTQPVHVVEEAHAAHGFSLGRKDHAKTYTCENVGAEHQMCNYFRGVDSIESTRTRFIGVHTLHVVNEGRLSGPILEFPTFDDSKPRPSNYKDFIGYIAHTKRNNGKRLGQNVAHITQEYTEALYCKQYGKCYICGNALGRDISFDRFIAGEAYDADTRLAHDACNKGKGRWPFEMLIARAKIVFESLNAQ